MENRNLNYRDVVLGILGLVMAIIGGFPVNKEIRIPLLSIAVVALGISVIFLYLSDFNNKVKKNREEIDELKKELNLQKNLYNLKVDIELIKNKLKLK